MVESNNILYEEGEKPDHCVVIKYVPQVGDSKRAMDEYTSEIMMGGHNTLVIHNTCEDSLLATPLIIDLIIIAEICERIQFKVGEDKEFQNFNAVLSLLSYLCKAPLVPSGTPVVNALFRQKKCIENIFRACLGLSSMNHMMLEYKHENITQKIPPRTPTSNLESLKANARTEISNGISNGVHNGDSSEGEKWASLDWITELVNILQQKSCYSDISEIDECWYLVILDILWENDLKNEYRYIILTRAIIDTLEKVFHSALMVLSRRIHKIMMARFVCWKCYLFLYFLLILDFTYSQIYVSQPREKSKLAV